jgi:hypothetical protein
MFRFALASSQTTLWKNATAPFFGGASYKIATTSGTITDTYATATSTDWVMVAIALRPATSTSAGASTAGSMHPAWCGGRTICVKVFGRAYLPFLAAGPMGLAMAGAGEKREVCAVAGFFFSVFGFRISRLLRW